jgi:hypothetical protein
MREQWQRFLDDNASCWAYNIVPELVERLAEAVELGDDEEVIDLLDSLYLQGVMLDDEGNLCFVVDYIYLFPNDWTV